MEFGPDCLLLPGTMGLGLELFRWTPFLWVTVAVVGVPVVRAVKPAPRVDLRMTYDHHACEQKKRHQTGGRSVGRHVGDDVHVVQRERVVPVEHVAVPGRVVVQRARGPGVAHVGGRGLDAGAYALDEGRGG